MKRGTFTWQVDFQLATDEYFVCCTAAATRTFRVVGVVEGHDPNFGCQKETPARKMPSCRQEAGNRRVYVFSDLLHPLAKRCLMRQPSLRCKWVRNDDRTSVRSDRRNPRNKAIVMLRSLTRCNLDPEELEDTRISHCVHWHEEERC